MSGMQLFNIGEASLNVKVSHTRNAGAHANWIKFDLDTRGSKTVVPTVSALQLKVPRGLKYSIGTTCKNIM